ncbi:unnamed protein product, partial [Chrysoparadoxa australica]
MTMSPCDLVECYFSTEEELYDQKIAALTSSLDGNFNEKLAQAALDLILFKRTHDPDSCEREVEQQDVLKDEIEQLVLAIVRGRWNEPQWALPAQRILWPEGAVLDHVNQAVEKIQFRHDLDEEAVKAAAKSAEKLAVLCYSALEMLWDLCKSSSEEEDAPRREKVWRQRMYSFLQQIPFLFTVVGFMGALVAVIASFAAAFIIQPDA